MGEVDHRGHLSAREFTIVVVSGNLGGAFLLANFRTEIYPQLECRLSRFRIGLGPDHSSDANIDFQKIVKRDFQRSLLTARHPVMVRTQEKGGTILSTQSRPARLLGCCFRDYGFTLGRGLVSVGDHFVQTLCPSLGHNADGVVGGR